METHLPVIDLSNSPTGCCPLFDPAPWDDKEFSFAELTFIVVVTKSFFYMPLNMGKMMSASQKAIQEAGAESTERYLMLSEDISKWKAHHYMLVTKEVRVIGRKR